MDKENQYLRQYPDLMAGKKIMYVHGFGSSAQSGTVTMLQTMLPNATVIAEDLPIHPDEAMQLLRTMQQDEQPALIIGTSMGGMYTEQLTGTDRILVNPAFQMGDTMSKHGMVGKQTFQNPRKDGVQEFIVTKALVKEYEEVTTHNFEAIDDSERQRVYGLFGDADPLVHTFPLFSQHYPNAIRFHGEHRLTDKVALHYLLPVIRWIDDRQEERERPVVYIDYATLHDSYGHATASMHKAYEFLLDNYSVYVVAPAPSNTPEHMQEVQAWVEEYLSAPAWNRVIFTNRLPLLYGDYYISPSPAPDFMGTTIVWGSDEFKTWEEIIVFFSRLGGQ